tara:strand:- start:5624 stop:5824 length:201 start_codon:yes stop_codon:yes gene_type:complete
MGKKIDHIIDVQKQQEAELVNEIILCILNGDNIKKKINLAIKPQNNKILKYLRTNDPSIFDGLKRK